MPIIAFDMDPNSLTLTVRDPRQFDAAESLAESIGVALYTSRVDGQMKIRCSCIQDLSLLGEMLADRAK